MNIEETIKELQKYSELDGTEWGESVERLVTLWYSRSMFSDYFCNAIEREIMEYLSNAQESADIVETEVTEPAFTHTVRELVWD
jgi:hypothetical protein